MPANAEFLGTRGSRLASALEWITDGRDQYHVDVPFGAATPDRVVAIQLFTYVASLARASLREATIGGVPAQIIGPAAAGNAISYLIHAPLDIGTSGTLAIRQGNAGTLLSPNIGLFRVFDIQSPDPVSVDLSAGGLETRTVNVDVPVDGVGIAVAGSSAAGSSWVNAAQQYNVDAFWYYRGALNVGGGISEISNNCQALIGAAWL